MVSSFASLSLVEMAATLISDIEHVLEVFTFEEVLAQNDLTLEDALYFLVDEEFLELPDVKSL